MTTEELAGILAEHGKWLRGEAGVRANLAGAYLAGANLAGANLARADLAGANLAGANLAGADLAGAYLAGANLAGANLAGADLAGAYLAETCLARVLTAYDWCQRAKCHLRTINFRVLALGSRTVEQPVMRGPAYAVGRVYTAPWFSRDTTTDCHPGLFVAGGPDCALDGGSERLLVAFWMDELLLAQTKARVPRFRTVATVEEFEALTVEDMEVTCDNGPG